MSKSETRRPVFFDLTKIEMPVGALTSITHRITGMLLVFGIPFCVYLLDLSLQGPLGHSNVTALLAAMSVKGVLIVLAWALAHHSLAGVRHLLSDIDIGSRLPAARRSAWIVNVGGVLVGLLTAAAML